VTGIGTTGMERNVVKMTIRKIVIDGPKIGKARQEAAVNEGVHR